MVKRLRSILLLFSLLFTHSAVTSLDLQQQSPQTSDGCESQIVFTFESGRRPLYIVKSDRTGLRQIKDDGVSGEYGFGLSPDGQQIGFMGFTNDNQQLYILNTDGTGLQQLLDTAEYRYYGFEWSPDGQWVLSTAFKNGDESSTNEIHLIEVATSRVVRFRLPESYIILGFDWSPDGRQIVFAAGQREDAASHSDIFVISVDGLIKEEQVSPINLTNNEVVNAAPRWSPNGDKITFESNRDGNYDIYVMNADGTEVVNQTLDDNDNFSPVWSPDGARIAYKRQVAQRVRDLYILNVNESSSPSLIFPSVAGFHWSPDGNHIAVSAGEIPDYDLYIVDTYTGNVTDLIGDVIDDLHWITGFDWSPCRS